MNKKISAAAPTGRSRTFGNAFSPAGIIKKVAVMAIAASMNLSVFAQDESASAASRTKAGVIAGVNYSTLSGWISGLYERADIEINKKPGIRLGLYFEENFKRSEKFGMQGELSFCQLGTRLEENYFIGSSRVRETGSITYNCLLVRSHLMFSQALGNSVVLSLHAGLHAGLSLWSSAKYEMTVNGQKQDGDSEVFFNNVRGGDVGAGIGAGLMFQEKIRIGVAHDVGIFFHNTAFTLTYMFGKK